MTLQLLILLQAVDLDLRRLRAELAELPRRTAAAQTALGAAQKALDATRKGLAEEEVLRRRQELDIAAHRGKIERLARQLDNATSATQVTALEKELSFTRAAIDTLEEEEYASMERTDRLDGVVAAQEAASASAQAVLARALAVQAETTKRHDAAVKELETERARLRTELFNPPADWTATTPEAPAALALYDRVARSKSTGPAGGTGLAEAVPDASGGGQCSACRMRVRPQRWQDIMSREHANDLFACETCGRLLFFDPRRNAPGEQPAIDRLRAALAAEPVSRR